MGENRSIKRVRSFPHYLARSLISGVQHLTVSGLSLDNSDSDEPNSDRFGISSSDYVTLENIVVYNRDNCVAVTSGTRSLSITCTARVVMV